ncbi:MAG: hypothetical protein IJY39_04935 [Clostridia bacterium]|nr:hypothetical protein [Clostridia bacterium]
MKKLHIFAFCLALILLIPICYYTVYYASSLLTPPPPPTEGEDTGDYTAIIAPVVLAFNTMMSEILAILTFIFAIFCMLLLYPVIQVASNRIMKTASISLFVVSVIVCLALLICFPL